MGRPFYPYEADDPDLDWLVSNFLYERPNFLPVEAGMLPLVLLPLEESYCEDVLTNIISEVDDTDEDIFRG